MPTPEEHRERLYHKEQGWRRLPSEGMINRDSQNPAVHGDLLFHTARPYGKTVKITDPALKKGSDPYYHRLTGQPYKRSMLPRRPGQGPGLESWYADQANALLLAPTQHPWDERGLKKKFNNVSRMFNPLPTWQEEFYYMFDDKGKPIKSTPLGPWEPNYPRQRPAKTRSKARKGGKKAQGCSRQTSKRYTLRPSPPYPANKCRGTRKRGNDGRLWVSRPAKNGVHRWVRAKRGS